MTIQHNLITGADLHEPKGVATATSGKVYIANGSSSGAWEYPLDGIESATLKQIPSSDGAGSVTWALPHEEYHAEIYITSGATAHTLAAASAYTLLNPVTEWTAGVTSNLTSTPANGSITLTLAGDYKVAFYTTFTTEALAAGTEYNFKFALDSIVETRKIVVQKHTTVADNVLVCGSTFLTVTAGQVLTVFVAGDAVSSSTTITPIEAGLLVFFLG